MVHGLLIINDEPDPEPPADQNLQPCLFICCISGSTLRIGVNVWTFGYLLARKWEDILSQVEVNVHFSFPFHARPYEQLPSSETGGTTMSCQMRAMLPMPLLLSNNQLIRAGKVCGYELKHRYFQLDEDTGTMKL